MEEALDLRTAWATKCLVRYPRELNVRLSIVTFMPYLDPCIGLRCDTIHSIKITLCIIQVSRRRFDRRWNPILHRHHLRQFPPEQRPSQHPISRA